MGDVLDLETTLAGFKAKYGNEIGDFGGVMYSTERIPTDIFPLDLALGGGIPRQRVTEIYGPEGASKTTIICKIIKSNQKIRPHEKAVIFDMEGTFDNNWAAVIGVDMDRVVVLTPDYTEQVADMMHQVVAAKDVGVVVLDSLAHCMAEAIGVASAEKQFMGNDAKAIRSMAKKLNIQMKRMRCGEEGENPPPAVIWINQITSKVGVIMGNPENTPGGHMPRFLYSLRLRISGKNIMDDKVSKVLPVAKQVQCVVKKYKVPITNMNSEFDLILQPYDGFKIGDCDDWNLIEAHAKANGLLSKGPKDKGWVLGKQTYKTLAEIRKRYYSDDDFKLGLQGAVVEMAMNATGFLAEQDAKAQAAADALPIEAEYGIDPKTGEVIEKAA